MVVLTKILIPVAQLVFLFGWNWNSMTPHETKNVGFAYIGSGLHMLGGNPSLVNVGDNPPLGQQSSGNQGIPTL